MSTSSREPLTSTTATPASSGAMTGLRWSAIVLALLGVVQALLGYQGFSGAGMPIEGHGIVGYVTVLVAIVAAIFAYLATKGGSKGLLMHAAGMAVIALAQAGLGESGVRLVHVILGVLFLLGAVALATLAWRKSA